MTAPSPLLRLALLVLLAGQGSAATATPAPVGPPLHRLYAIGNSLTYGVLALPQAAQVLGEGTPLTIGMHIRWGSPLATILHDAAHPSVTTPGIGAFPAALAMPGWDALVLQPSFAAMEGPQGDLAVCQTFIAQARAHVPQVQVYIDEVWPAVHGATRFATPWARPYAPGCVDAPLWGGDYVPLLVQRLQAADGTGHPPIRIIPCGHALAALDAQLRVHPLPDLDRVEALYAPDGIHLTTRGYYVALCTWAAALHQRSPVGRVGPAIDPAISDGFAAAAQACAWTAVTACTASARGDAAAGPQGTGAGR